MKSNVSDQMEYMQAIYLDACMKCVADVSDLRDLGTLRSRLENEGMSFLTITLPSFCADFDKSLSEGRIDSKYFRNFRKYRAIPAFLQGMLSRIFDVETGSIYDEQTSSNSDVRHEFNVLIESVRQICLAYKKVQLRCLPKREVAAINSFITIERSFKEFLLQPEERELFVHVSRVLWCNVISRIDMANLRPKHGPGATADRISGNQKFYWLGWHDRIEPYFPIVGFGYPLGLPADSRELDILTVIPPDRELPVRITLVPKTLKSPRIIAIEPCCQQFAQQGIRDALYRVLETSDISAGHVNFSDQSVNQKLAISASISGLLATIDLSDASDRVPRDLALEMFRSHPDLMDAVDASRSTRALMPDGTIVPLDKFASMGSALCFPVEAMYFYTLCVMAILGQQGSSISFSSVFNATRMIFVYGDDLIVPTQYATSVLETLRKYNCKVNDSKTFYTGKFRESCGVDAYDGMQVQPVYVRHMPPKDRRDAKAIVSWCKTGNLFAKKGYFRTAAFVFEKLERLVGPLPCVGEQCSGLGRTFPWASDKPIKTRFNRRFQRIEVSTLVPRPVYRPDRLDGYAALSKSLSILEDASENPHIIMDMGSPLLQIPGKDELHLERSALHGAVTLQRRWVSPF